MSPSPMGSGFGQLGFGQHTTQVVTRAARAVGDVVARLRKGGNRLQLDRELLSAPAPLDEPHLGKLRSPNGRGLLPSLKAWFGYDASWFKLFAPTAPHWMLTTLSAFLSAEYRELHHAAPHLPAQFSSPSSYVDELLGGAYPSNAPVVMLPPSDTQAHLYLFAEPDAEGEYPILAYEEQTLWLKFRSFDECLMYVVRSEGFLAAQFGDCERG